MALPKCSSISTALDVITGYHLGRRREEEREKELLSFSSAGFALSRFEIAVGFGVPQLRTLPPCPSSPFSHQPCVARLLCLSLPLLPALNVSHSRVNLSSHHQFSSVQFSSVTQSCLTLCDPMNRSTPSLPVHHRLPEFTQTRVHRVSDAIQPSHPLSSPSSPAPNPSQHQSLFQ